MFRALLWKELRSGWPVAALGLVFFSWIALSIAKDFAPGMMREFDVFTNWTHSRVAFGELGGLGSMLAFFSISFGVLLGLWQTLPESLGGTAAFLVQTARSRERIVSAKIVAACILFAASVFLPAVLGIESVIRNNDWIIPLMWSDFGASWIALACGVIAYLGVLAAGLRGPPWREGFRQLSGLVVVAACIAFARSEWALDLTLGAMAACAGFAGLWAFTGFAGRDL